MDYMLVARSKSGDGFSNEPGAVYFLGVPSVEDSPKFRHKMPPRLAECNFRGSKFRHPKHANYR